MLSVGNTPGEGSCPSMAAWLFTLLALTVSMTDCALAVYTVSVSSARLVPIGSQVRRPYLRQALCSPPCL